MKKIVFVYVLILFNITNVFSQTINNKDISFYTDTYRDCKMTIKNNEITEIHEEFNLPNKNYTRDSLKLSKDGYYYFLDDENQNTPIIFGNNFFGFYINTSAPFKRNTKGWNEACEANGNYYRLYRSKDLNTVYSCSSELQEGKTLFESANLGKLFFPPDCIDLAKPEWNPNHKPWVEAAKGNGEGEYIEIKTDIEFDNLKILNGYVDLTRFDLYKKNSRVKIFIIDDLDNNIKSEIELVDEVIFQDFKLAKPTKHIRLIIKEVYKGDKWEDTCVSSILPY